MGTPILERSGSAAADDATVFEIADNAELFDTWIFSSTAGAMDVFTEDHASAEAMALIDLNSTAPSTAVTETAAHRRYGLKGRYTYLKVLQKGATAVVGAKLTGYVD